MEHYLSDLDSAKHCLGGWCFPGRRKGNSAKERSWRALRFLFSGSNNTGASHASDQRRLDTLARSTIEQTGFGIASSKRYIVSHSCDTNLGVKLCRTLVGSHPHVLHVDKDKGCHLSPG